MFDDKKLKDFQQLPADNLAYIGDAVYELYIRLMVMSDHDAKAGKLHRYAVHYARAKFQSNAAVKVQAILDETEKAVLIRGRNQNVGSMPKNAGIQEYRWATGLETLIGYLYLSGNKERLDEVMDFIIKTDESNQA